MTKEAIIKELSERHFIFVNYILSLSYNEFTFSFQNRWTAGQQMDHIYRSTSFLPLAFKIPRFICGLVLGKAKRQPLEYDELVQKYLVKLEKGGARTNSVFKPVNVPYSDRIDLAEKLVEKVSKINTAIDLISERELDEFLLPHPLLGKVSYREMLYFTMYHVDHHRAITRRYIAEME